MITPAKAGRYELLEELGSGAMGIVYRAQDPVIGRTVAVKTMRLVEQGNGLSHAELFARFQTEARAAGRLGHPNIVVVHDAGEEEGLFYITMELIEGHSLQAQIEARQAFPMPRVLRLMQQACAALDFAHQRNVVHRDIKPANLMLTPDDTLKITDFGTAKIVAIGSERTVQIIGTPSYMSPEQIKGRPIDGRSDIFSLGVVLYELVTGEKPFSGDNVTTVIYKIVNEEPPPPRELDPSIHPGLSAVILRALAKSPAFRYRSCTEFFEALRDSRTAPPADSGIRSAAATPFPARTPVSGAGRAVLVKTTPSRQPFKPERTSTHHRGLLLLLLMLLAILLGAGYRLWPALHGIMLEEQAVPALRQPVQSSPPSPGAFSSHLPAATPAALPTPAFLPVPGW